MQLPCLLESGRLIPLEVCLTLSGAELQPPGAEQPGVELPSSRSGWIGTLALSSGLR